jgi:serine/threonine protein phosphatase 1
MRRASLHRKIRHLRLPRNKQGRDFIVGDLHGHYRPLLRLLRQVKFSPRHDRLILVGDLTDRGPDSRRCLRLLNRSWVHSVLGNHDMAFCINVLGVSRMNAHERSCYAQIGEHDGGAWYMRGDRAGLEPLARKLDARPHILTVGDKRADYHVVHACLHPFNREVPVIMKDATLSIFVSLKEQEDFIIALTGERGLWMNTFPARSTHLAPVYCGHTMLREPRWSLGHFNLDTGAGAGGRLSAICFQTQERWSIAVFGQARAILTPPLPKKRRGVKRRSARKTPARKCQG